MKNRYDVIIVGGGVIGSSIAFQLSKRHYRVLIVEKGTIAQKASSAAAGMLGAQNELEKDRALFPIALKSRAMFPGLAEELKSLSNIDIELIQSGILRVAQTEQEVARLQSVAAYQQNEGEEVEWLSEQQVKAKEPQISQSIIGGLYMPNDGQVSPPLLTKALAQSAANLGAEILEFTEAIDFIHENGHISGVRTGIGSFYAEKVIVAGGSWSKQILEKLELSIDAYPVKGECFSVRIQKPIISSSIFSTGAYIVPKSGDRLIVGATERSHTFDESVQLKGLYQLMMNAIQIIPALKQAKWEKTWAGIRPQTRDGLPYLGEHPQMKGLFIATGHYRNGILLAPITGLFMADLLERKESEDHPFRIDRLSKEVSL
jgi:glycine oxidase